MYYSAIVKLRQTLSCRFFVKSALNFAIYYYCGILYEEIKRKDALL